MGEWREDKLFKVNNGGERNLRTTPPLGEEGVYIGTAKLTIASSKPKKKIPIGLEISAPTCEEHHACALKMRRTLEISAPTLEISDLNPRKFNDPQTDRTPKTKTNITRMSKL
jgi:hypothetical protein